MSEVAVSAPGGKVGLKKFGVYVVGGALGVVAYDQFVAQYIDDKYENMSLGPVTGGLALRVAFAMLGAGLASKFIK